jgi:hypothetical protein
LQTQEHLLQLALSMKRMLASQLWLVKAVVVAGLLHEPSRLVTEVVVAGLLHGLDPSLTSEEQPPDLAIQSADGRAGLQGRFRKASIRGPSTGEHSAKPMPGNMLVLFLLERL